MLEEEDLEQQGLIASSYDSLFGIRKRVRKINDLQLPTRRGVGVDQLGIGVLVFIIFVILYGLVVVPLTELLGIGRDVRFLLAWLFIPPFLAGQQIAKPMPHGKSIGGTISSWLRFHLDDPVHRRGVPVPRSKRAPEVPTLHYQRIWVPAVDLEPGKGEEMLSDSETERRFEQGNISAGGKPVALQGWYDARAREHARMEREARQQSAETISQEISFRRGAPIGVIVPNDDENSEDL